MSKPICILALCSLAAAVPRSLHNAPLSDNAPVIQDEIIEHVNSRRTTWVAGHNDKFDGMTVAQAKTLMGTLLDGPRPPALVSEYDADAVPDSFDARTQWPDCP